MNPAVLRRFSRTRLRSFSVCRKRLGRCTGKLIRVSLLPAILRPAVKRNPSRQQVQPLQSYRAQALHAQRSPCATPLPSQDQSPQTSSPLKALEISHFLEVPANDELPTG